MGKIQSYSQARIHRNRADMAPGVIFGRMDVFSVLEKANDKTTFSFPGGWRDGSWTCYPASHDCWEGDGHSIIMIICNMYINIRPSPLTQHI